MVIVTPRSLEAAIRPYAEARGDTLRTTVAVLEDALAQGPGVDDPEKLKRFLYGLWNTSRSSGSPLRYVLLAGDADVLPVRYMCLDRVTAPAFDYAFYPSDLYYADIAKADGSFEDWNGACDGFHAQYFGEVRGEKNKSDPINYDRIDYKPELCVGRWPVSTPEQAKIVADKSIAYAKGLAEGSRQHWDRAGLVAVGGWIENRGMMDAVAGSLPRSWGIEKRYWGMEHGSAAPAGGNSAAAPAAPALGPEEKNIVDLMNDGVLVLLHSGHGADDLWAESISTHSITKLHNADRLPIVMSAGCSTARFATLPPYEPYVDVDGGEHAGSDHGEVFTAPPPPPACYQKGKYNMTGLGERLLRDGPSGAVAYIGCNTGSQPCGMTLLTAFAEEIGQRWGMVEPGIAQRLGDCWAGAVSKYYDREHLADLKPNADWYPPSIFFQGMKFMLFGDPSLPIGPSQVGK